MLSVLHHRLRETAAPEHDCLDVNGLLAVVGGLCYEH